MKQTDHMSYHTDAHRSSELHDLMSSHHRANGKGVHMPVGNISKTESRGRLYKMTTHLLSAFPEENSSSRREVSVFSTLWPLTLTVLQSALVANP